MRKAALVYAAASVVYTWPLILNPTSRLGAPVGPGDPFLYLWVFGWGMETILRAPVDVLTESRNVVATVYKGTFRLPDRTIQRARHQDRRGSHSHR